MQMISPANLVAAMLLTAFVIERAIAAGAFVVSLFRLKGEAREELLATLLRTVFAGAIAAAVIYKFDWMRLLSTFDVYNHPNADKVLTWLVLVSGTDRLSAFIGAGADKAASSRAKEAALEVHGTLAVDNASAQAVSKRTEV